MPQQDLLDSFALAVLEGATARLGMASQGNMEMRKDIARRCYLMAHAMVKERERWVGSNNQQQGSE